MSPISRRLPILLALLAALAVAFAACGGGSSQDPAQVLDETFGASKPVKSGKLDLDLNVAIKGRSSAAQAGPIAVKLSGPFQSHGSASLPAFNFAFSVAAAGRSVQAGAVSTGTSGYVVVRGQAYQLSPAEFAQFKQGYEQSARRTRRPAQPLSALGIDPRRWIRNAETKDNEDIGGTDTVHVSAQVNIPKLLADVSRVAQSAGQAAGGQGRQLTQRLTPAQQLRLARAVRSARIDVYSGADDKTLRRLTVTLDLAGQAGSSSSGGTVALTLTLSDLNQPQQIAAPANAKPLSDLTSTLQQGLGGLGGTGGAASGAGAYEQCLAQAQGDIAKQQQCASLLGGQ
ncbi:MAG: hypothetical protein U0R70_04815 [Solirubrobacteraceae bacterium]